MKACPNEDQLSDLIRGALSGTMAGDVTEHVGDCESCQSKIQDLAAGEMPVESLVAESATALPEKDSAYWIVRESLSHQLPGDLSRTKLHSTQASEVEVPDVNRFDPQSSSTELTSDELAFLDPSDDPAYVGCLQDFKIVRMIGRGGMGVVLEAFDPHLHRTVAIKVLNARFQRDKAAIGRFCREGRSAASISHEHVVPMYQVARVEEGEIAFLVMQLIDGKTLDECLQEQSPMAADEVARIGMQIAAGLSAAHSNGLVHRDIKPGNVLIEKSTGRVKLTDFGLAMNDTDVKLTQTGTLVGTALYMSPEQALGGTVDERSDLFSLGAVMYEMATGQSPFVAPTAVGVMKRIMDEAPTPPHKINPKIGKPTSELILQLLSKNAEDRPDSASLVAKALASIVTEHGPISPLQVPAVSSTEVRQLSRRKTVGARTWASSGWLAAALLLAGVVFSMLSGWTPWIRVRRWTRKVWNSLQWCFRHVECGRRVRKCHRARFLRFCLPEIRAPCGPVDFSRRRQHDCGRNWGRFGAVVGYRKAGGHPQLQCSLW